MKSELFTARQIGACIGKDRFAIRRALASVPRSGIRPDCGNADAWSITALPESIRAELRAVHERVKMIAGYRTLADVLRNPPDRWHPVVPLAQAAPGDVRQAEALQRAFTAALALPEDATDSERARRAADDYRREFGHAVSDRHLRALIRRTLDRDGGAREFHRLELYLADSPRRTDAATGAEPSAAVFDFAALEDAFSACESLTSPTIADRDYCWRAVVTFWNEAADRGDATRPLRSALLAFLDRTLPRLGKSREAIERGFERKLKAFAEEGAEALCDQRTTNSGRHRKPADWDENTKLFARWTMTRHGRASQAWRELMLGTTPTGERFSEAFRDYFPFNVRQAKSRVPASMRTFIRPIVAAVTPHQLGPRAVRLSKAIIRRDSSDTDAGDYFTSDDVSINHVWFDWHEGGEFIYEGRRFTAGVGQWLPCVDERSEFPLGFLLMPSKSYNSEAICSLNLQLFMDDRIGLPFKGMKYENGIWGARNIKAQFAWSKISEAFARQGVTLSVRHATTPRAKIIESVIGRSQNLMDHLPGYIGHCQMKEKFEREVKFVQSLKRVGQPFKAEVDPSKKMLSKEQMADEICKVMNRFAADIQNGERLPGISPAEAWERFSPGRPHHVLPDSLRYLLSTRKSTQTVAPEGGLMLRIGGQPCYYVGSERLGELKGEKVIAYFNPELPEMVSVIHPASDPKGVAPFTVPLQRRLPANTATAEDFAEIGAQRRAFAKFGANAFRLIAPPRNVTMRNEQLGTDDLRATGAALHANEREHIEVTTTRKRHAGEIARLADLHNLRIDPSKDRDPTQTVQFLREIDEIEQRIIDQEAAADGEAVSQVKPYKLTLPPGAGLTRKQREAIYWKARNELEAALGKPAVIAITRKTLGAIVAASQLSDEQLAKMTSVFAAILRDRAAATI